MNEHESQLKTIYSLFDSGVRSQDIKPEEQLAPWLIEGLKRMEAGGQLTQDEIAEIELMGGTNHPDPTLRSMGK